MKTNLIDVGTLNRFMRALAEDSGMTVRFTDDDVEPRRVNNTIYIPRPADNATDEDLAKLRWFALRESLRFAADGGYNLDSFDGAAAQVFDDVRLEGQSYGRYRGDRTTIDTALPPVLENYAEAVAKHIDEADHVPENMLKFLALTLTAQAAKGEWSGVVGAASSLMASKLPPKVAEYMGKLVDAGYLDKLNETETTDDSYRLAAEAKRMLDIDEDPPQPDGNDGDDGEGDGDDENNDENQPDSGNGSSREQQPDNSNEDNDDDGTDDGEPDPSDGDGDESPDDSEDDSQGQGEDQPEHEGDGEEDSEPDESEQESEADGDAPDDGDESDAPGTADELAPPDNPEFGDGNKSGAEVDYRSFIPGENSKDSATQTHAENDASMLEGNGLDINYDNWNDHYNGGVRYDEDWLQITDRDKVERRARHDKARAIGDNMRQYLADSGTNARVLGNKLRRVLQVRSQAQWEGGHKSGRLHRKALYRAAAPTLGNGEWNRKIHRKKIDGVSLDTAIGLLIDGSGSMGGRKILAAASSAALLCDSVANALNIPTEVTLFSTGERTDIREIKRFDERMRTDGIIDNVASAASMGMNCNEDGAAVMEMYERLRVRKEPRKIMIVLSDGQPAGRHVYDSAGYLKRVVDEILDRGDVELYGIGIMSDSVTHFYPDHVVINSPAELESAVLSVVRNKLI